MTPEQQKQAEMMVRNIKEMGQYSYELEEKREQSLLDQAGKMLTAFALFTAALNMLLSAVLTHATIPISKNKLILLGGIVSFFLLVSLVLAIMAQWRYGYIVMMDAQKIYEQVKEDFQNYPTQAEFDKQWMYQLKQIHYGKRRNNERRVKLIKASMVVFLFAVLQVIVVSVWTVIQFFN